MSKTIIKAINEIIETMKYDNILLRLRIFGLSSYLTGALKFSILIDFFSDWIFSLIIFFLFSLLLANFSFFLSILDLTVF